MYCIACKITVCCNPAAKAQELNLTEVAVTQYEGKVSQTSIPLEQEVTLEYGQHSHLHKEYFVAKYMMYIGSSTGGGHYAVLERRQAKPGIFTAADTYVYLNSAESTAYASLAATPGCMAQQVVGALLISKKPPQDDPRPLSVADPTAWCELCPVSNALFQMNCCQAILSNTAALRLARALAHANMCSCLQSSLAHAHHISLFLLANNASVNPFVECLTKQNCSEWAVVTELTHSTPSALAIIVLQTFTLGMCSTHAVLNCHVVSLATNRLSDCHLCIMLRQAFG